MVMYTCIYAYDKMKCGYDNVSVILFMLDTAFFRMLTLTYPVLLLAIAANFTYAPLQAYPCTFSIGSRIT